MAEITDSQNELSSEQTGKDPFLPVKTSWQGAVVGLHLAPRGMLPMRSVQCLNLIAGVGVEGDRYSRGAGALSELIKELGVGDVRQLTLFEEEVLQALRRDHGVELAPEEHRQNITTRGVPLNHLVGRRFRVGVAILRGALAAPCKHLDEVLGRPVSNLLINRRGLNAQIIQGGVIRLGDAIEAL